MTTTKNHRPWLLLCIAALALAVLTAILLPSPFPELEVGGFRISQEEYLRAMYRARNDVLSDHAAAGISLTDWSAETALGDPCMLVTERAIELLTEYYAVGTLAVERGYLADASYDAMLRDLEAVNQKRQEALDAGAVVTGFPSFSTEDYITYRTSSLGLQFCNDPGNPENQVSPGELRERYETDRERLYGQASLEEVASVVAQSIRASRYDALIAERMEAMEISADLQSLYRFTAEQLH